MVSRQVMVVGICSIIIFLSSCSFLPTGSTEDAKRQDMAIINENLELKDRVVELEESISMIEKNQQTTFGINEDVFLFMRAFETKDLVELRNRVAVDVSIESTGITFDNGNSLRYGVSQIKDCLEFMKLKEHEFNSDKGIFVYDVFSVGNKTEAKQISVEVVQQENGWKINNVTGEI